MPKINSGPNGISLPGFSFLLISPGNTIIQPMKFAKNNAKNAFSQLASMSPSPSPSFTSPSPIHVPCDKTLSTKYNGFVYWK